MRKSGRMTASVGFSHHDHLCWVYRGEQAWWAAISSFLVEGAARRDQLVLVTDQPDDVPERLARMPSASRLLARGQLRVVDLATWHDALRAEPPWQARLETWVDDALVGGLRGVRVAADATLLLLADAFGQPQTTELALDRLVCDLPLTVLCGYDGDRVPPDVGVGLCFAHPLWHGAKGEVAANLFAEQRGHWRLNGSLDLMTRTELGLALAATQAGSGDVELELSGLDFIDVGGVRELVNLANGLADSRSLVLRDAPRGLQEILRIGWSGGSRIRMVSR